MDAVWSRLVVYMGGLMNRYRQVSECEALA